MPSPFPGMDPFIEGQWWRTFHTRFITVLGDMLTPQVRPRYIVEIEEYVYLAREDEEPDRLMEPDLAVAEIGLEPAIPPRSTAGTVTTIQPVIHTLPVPKRCRQPFLSIRDRKSQNVVTVLEMLSPWNKVAGEGRSEYLVKRSNISYTPAHLVELDLLRGGQRLPTREPLESADFFAFVCRKEQWPKVEVYAWTLRESLPTIPVPLDGDDPDVPLDLQAAFTTTYDRAGFDYAIDYRRTVEPPLDPATADWVRSLLPQ